MEIKNWIKEIGNSSKLGNIISMSNEEFDKIMGPEIEKAIYRLLHPTREQIKKWGECEKNSDLSFEWEVDINK